MSELPEKDTSNELVWCKFSLHSTISCRGLCPNYLKTIAQKWWSAVSSVYNKLSLFVSELPKNDISNVVVRCRFSLQ